MQEIKPKKKSTVPLFRLGDCIYFSTSGVSAEIPDKTGAIESLIHAMDGNRVPEQLHQVVQQKYPSVTLEEIIESLEQLDRAGFLENAAFDAQGLLNEYELKRWERNINFLGSFADMRTNKFELQSRLKTKRVVLLGLGGLGSHLLYDLVALGVQDIRVVEFDKVELANLNRQILYTESDIGRLKAEVAAERILAFNPHLRLEAIPQRLNSLDDVLSVIQDRECVLCAADRPKSEIIQWVNEACVRQNIPLITGGLDTQRGVYYTVVPQVTGCVECWRLQVEQNDPISSALLTERRRMQLGGDNAAFVPLVMLVSGLMLSEFVRLTTQIDPLVATGRLMEIRFSTMVMQEVEQWKKLDTCPICATVSRAC